MSFAGNSPKIPNITGYPVLDTLIKWALGIGAAALAAWTAGWLSAHGFKSQYITSENLLLVIVPAFAAIAAVIWSLVSKYKSYFAWAEKVLEAANTGLVPADVKAVATSKQVTRIELAGK